ncbi:Autophagy-related protein 21 [Scheffersomyces stipitis CBS 6054]|uniref:Autophagy-related protein 21 n=1 Tax=Scheffersomyces stipitis (strain ATCC 58785 / CBS 6054 / NBRC 10063 / NRRL Y-11545) TaxID=322104 RepID=A3LXK6_PICST|nr:Autophagy-related protein 21 [Scheffersomyces stipitis CBS 6054]ABN67821.2 Autophagy-related protein 21 [Scheffersomyces stipitis CBS 6054]
MTTINDLTFNQDYSCISISTSNYHRIFNCEPFGQFYSSSHGNIKKTLSNSIETNTVNANVDNNTRNSRASLETKCPTAYLKMLFSTSLTIIVPQSQNKLGNRLLKIYNLKQNLKICELSFPSNIINIKLNRKRLLVFLEIGHIYIYDLSCVRLIKILEVNSYLNETVSTANNLTDSGQTARLIGDLSADDNSFLVLPLSAINDQTDLFNHEHSSASPSRKSDSTIIANSLDSLIEYTHKDTHHLHKKGSITLDDLKKDSNGWVIVYDTIELRPRLIFKAHNSSIGKITVSNDNSKIATASVKGTIIRVFSIDSNSFSSDKLKISQVTNLRRGHNLARINTLSFNADNSILGCGSESNTIHFFRLNEKAEATSPGNSDEGNTEDYEANDHDSESSEDLNENLANLLVSNPAPPVDAEENHKQSKSYFSFSNLKSTTKLINNQYTKSIIKKLPYKDYFENLIWEPPRRSFAYIKLPEYTPPHHYGGQHFTSESTSPENRVEIGFSNSLILLASYQTGIFYHYQLPKPVGSTRVGSPSEEEKREECYLINQYSLV